MITPHYVLCFAFCPGMTTMAAIRRKKPKLFAAKMNVPGGTIQPGETAQMAAQRKFLEETGVKTNKDKWIRFATVRLKRATLTCLLIVTPKVHKVATVTEEMALPASYMKFMEPDLAEFLVAPNTTWLAAMAVQAAQGHNPVFNIQAVFDV